METQAPSMENPKISAYYQTRLAHFGVVSTEWLAQAQSATNPLPSSSTDSDTDKDTNFSVIDEFNRWRNHPDLAEAVAAIRALAAAWDTTSISLTAASDLFMRYVTRTSALEFEDFNSAKSRLIERADKFGEISYK
ncbi:translation initiation factor eIF-2B subunit alpha-like, partial [Trifolium medium]|nr:translation initiation factor eIF-2B subunit alpha-like [Trifolium medium]